MSRDDEKLSHNTVNWRKQCRIICTLKDVLDPVTVYYHSFLSEEKINTGTITKLQFSIYQNSFFKTTYAKSRKLCFPNKG